MNIPKNAKRVFKGEIFDVYQWPQKMFDGSTRTFEKVSRKDTVAIIATVGNKIVILKQKQPRSIWYYDLVGGRIDEKGANPKKQALKELLEETGMKPDKLFLYKKFPVGGHVEYTIYLFVARNCKKIAKQALDGGEKIKMEIVSYDELLLLTEKPAFYANRIIIDLFLKARINQQLKKELKKTIFG